MSPEGKKRKKTISPARKRFSDWIKSENQKRSQIVKVLPKGVLPLVTSNQPSVSNVPKGLLVSANPPISIPRYWGRLPSRKWPRTGLPIRHIRAIRPVEMGTFGLLTHTFFFWAQPALQIAAIADDIREQSEEERTEEGRVNSELLELKMRYETEEISEKEYKREEAKLKKRLEDIREGREEKVTEEKLEKEEKKPKKRKKKKKKS